MYLVTVDLGCIVARICYIHIELTMLNIFVIEGIEGGSMTLRLTKDRLAYPIDAVWMPLFLLRFPY